MGQATIVLLSSRRVQVFYSLGVSSCFVLDLTFKFLACTSIVLQRATFKHFKLYLWLVGVPMLF